MKSGIYLGAVKHARPGPPAPSPARVDDSVLDKQEVGEGAGGPRHRLTYKLFMLAFDLDEIDALRGVKLFSHNRANLMALYDRDHAGRANAPLKPQIERKLREAGIAWDGGEITLLCMPRLLGYVFNPLSVYFCQRRSGELAALVHEVRNTFGEQHFYVLPANEGADGAVKQSCAKDFFVSPFLEMDLRYEFRIKSPEENVVVAMSVWRGPELALTASFAGERRELTDANLLRAFAGNPLMTFVAIAGIHWEALKMLAKGVPFLGRPRAEAALRRQGA